MVNGTLKVCSSSPNCVSSQAGANDSEHFIEPFAIGEADATQIWERLAMVVAEMPRVTIVERDARYLRAEIRSFLFRFVDDLECVLDVDAKLIHWRSASRVGYSDLGVNRKRIEELRSKLQTR